MQSVEVLFRQAITMLRVTFGQALGSGPRDFQTPLEAMKSVEVVFEQAMICVKVIFKPTIEGVEEVFRQAMGT